MAGEVSEPGVEDVVPVAEELGGEQGDGFQTVQAQTTSPRQLTASAGVLVTQQLGEPVLECCGTQVRDSQEVDGARILQSGGPDELLEARRLTGGRGEPGFRKRGSR